MTITYGNNNFLCSKDDWYLPIGPIDKSWATLAPTPLSIIAMQAVMHVNQCHHGNQ